MDKIQIVEWNDQYSEDYISLSVEWLEKYVSVEPADLEILNHPHNMVLDNGGNIFFALDGEKPVGTVSMINCGDNTFELAKLAVTEEYKGRKIGNLLMNSALRFARENNGEKIILYTNRRLISAINLYKKYGFQEVMMEHNKYLEADMMMEYNVSRPEGREDKMEFMNTALNRRSVRKYKNEAIPREKLDKILQAGLLAPTSRNLKPCEFVVVKDREVLKKLSKAKKMGSGFVSDAPVAVAVFGDSKKADTWIEDCSIAMTYMMLTATDLGIGSCWCQLHLRSSLLGKDAEETAKELLSMPDNYRIVGVLALGFPEKELQPKTLDEADFSKVKYI